MTFFIQLKNKYYLSQNNSHSILPKSNFTIDVFEDKNFVCFFFTLQFVNNHFYDET